MRSFLIGLQFLTRLHVVRQEVWTEADFGGSVRWFPLVGAVLGLFYAGAAILLFWLLPYAGLSLPPHVGAAILAALPVLLTGGLHYDGFMDTVDGVFSGRSRERMLEIMKDSRVGSYGACAMMLVFLLQWSLLVDLPRAALPMALFLMPVVGRFCMAVAIAAFPYARPEGIGRAFSLYANRRTTAFAGLGTAALLLPWGREAWLAALLAALVALGSARFFSRTLGGVTGDVYGAVELLAETAMLFGVLSVTFFQG